MTIQDEFSHIPNKQARFYFRKLKAGRCAGCNGPRDDQRYQTCSTCRKKRSDWKKAKYVPKERKPHYRKSKYL